MPESSDAPNAPQPWWPPMPQWVRESLRLVASVSVALAVLLAIVGVAVLGLALVVYITRPHLLFKMD